MTSLTEALGLLIRTRPYESDTLQALEGFVATEYSSNGATYDFEANRALLKIYQLYPEHLKLDVLANIFILTLYRYIFNSTQLSSINSTQLNSNRSILLSPSFIPPKQTPSFK